MKLILIHLSYSGCPSSSVSTCVQHRKLLRRYITFILNKVQNKVQCILYCPSQSRQTTFQLLTCFIRPGAVVLDSTDEENKTGVEGTSLVVQWLRLHDPNAGAPGSIPGQGPRSHMPQLKDPACHN